MSDHKILVKKLPTISKHPNADTLGIVILEGYPSIIKLGTLTEGSLVVFIPPDFVYQGARVKCVNLRKVKSYGLVLPAPEGSVEGEDVMEKMGITRWVSPSDLELFIRKGDCVKAPFKDIPIYDVESYRNAPWEIPMGSQVRITEKVHGSNIRMVYHDGAFHIGTHGTWREYTDYDRFWKVFENHPGIKEILKAHPDEVFYGEAYGHQKGFPYNSELGLVLFDIWANNKWVTSYAGYDDAIKYWVPILYEGPLTEKQLPLCDGKSLLGNHIREGIVIREIFSGKQLKVVSDAYLEKS